MRRRLLHLLWVGPAAMALGAASLPWWLGPILERAGAPRGLTFSRYERIGYSRFALHGVEVRQPAVRVSIARLEADTPLVAWWRRGEILAGPWIVAIPPRAPLPAATGPARGWVPLRAMLQRVAAGLERWTPRVTLQAGVVRWPDGEVTCASAHWREGTLAVQALAWRGGRADASLAFTAGALRLAGHGAGVRLAAESRGGTVAGKTIWAGQRATWQAEFDASGWLPRTAEWHAPHWEVPGEKLRLGARYPVVRGAARLEWRHPAFQVRFAATAEPAPGTAVPPLAVTLRGRGDTESVTLEALEIVLPGIAARLSEPVTVERSGKLRAGDARFTLEANLAQVPWFAATGVVTGEAHWQSPPGQPPRGRFQIAARGVTAAGWDVAALAADGRFDWPVLRVAAATVTGPAGDELRGHGGWDFSRQELLDTTIDGRILPATVARWLPAGLAGAAVTVHAEAAGPLAGLKHAGTARTEKVTYGALPPFRLALAWSGRGAQLESLAAEASAGATNLVLAGSTQGTALQVTKLEWSQGGGSRLKLSAPATVHWRPAWRVERLHLAGPEGAVEASGAWGETGHLSLRVRNFSSTWLADLVGAPGPAWRVTSLVVSSSWDRGPMEFSLEGTGTVELRAGRSADLALSLQGDRHGVRLNEVALVEGGRHAIRATGQIPLRLNPAAPRPWDFDEAGAVTLDVQTGPSASLWAETMTLTGWELQEPDASAHLTGTWAHPRGTVRLRAARVTADPARFARPLPVLEALELDLSGDESGLRLDRLAVSIEGQTVRAHGRLPLSPAGWRQEWRNSSFWFRPGAEGRLEIPGAEVAAFARFLPAFVAPKGRIQLDLGYRQGAWAGTLQVHDAFLLPLGPLGALQDIEADIGIAGRTLELRAVTAQSGGQTVTLSGTVTWPEAGAAAVAEALQFALALKGENLPFVRQAGALVRGDLDLQLLSPPRGPPRIAGTITLRDSLFLSDLRALLPGGTKTQARTPPYFAVETAPFSAWRLDVAVQGKRFLQLRTPLFQGVASARVQLSGTLGAPRAQGEATLDEGLVRLPFASFTVQEGRVTVTPEHGGEPQIWLVGTVRRFNHDLRLEVQGPASAPLLTFSSSPPLEAGQVLLMVMTGVSSGEGTAFSDRQRMARFGTFLGQSLLASLGGEGAAAERLSISTGENVSRQGRETYGFEYQWNDRWSIVGEYDEFDEFNAGLKWRLFSRGGQDREEKP